MTPVRPLAAHADVIRLSRPLASDVLALLTRQLTTAGHLAQIVPAEHRGVCDVRGCGPSCLAAQATLHAFLDALGVPTEAPATVEAPDQLGLFEREATP